MSPPNGPSPACEVGVHYSSCFHDARGTISQRFFFVSACWIANQRRACHLGDMSDGITFGDRVVNAVSRTILGGALLLPYRARVRLVGWVFSHLIAPVAGWRKRVQSNLAYIHPDMSGAEVNRIAKAVTNNMGRTLIEIYSGEEFIAHAKPAEIVGPGLPALMEAKASKRPVVFVTAHLGNYDVIRSKLSRDGFPMAALYRPMKNPLFHAHYLKAISTIAKPVFPTDGKGIAGLVKHLKDGGCLGIVADVGSRKAPVLEFFDKPAHTPLSSAEWALKYNALLIPIFGIRNADGFSFTVHVDAPIPEGEPAEMMQTYNDAVEAIVMKHPDQWFWVHRRWKLRADVALNAGVTPPQ